MLIKKKLVKHSQSEKWQNASRSLEKISNARYKKKHNNRILTAKRNMQLKIAEVQKILHICTSLSIKEMFCLTTFLSNGFFNKLK